MHRQQITRTHAAWLIVPIFVLVATAALSTSANDWPQWCGSDGKNMVSDEKGIPESFAPGRKRSDKTIDLSTATNVKWGVKVGDAFYGTPTVAGGKVFVGGLEDKCGIFVCFDAATGKCLWKWKVAPRDVPKSIDGFSVGAATIPQEIGLCSTAAVEGDRAYLVSNRFDVVCLETGGTQATAGCPRVVWSFDMWQKLGVFPADTANGSPLIVGDLLYVPTSNGRDLNYFGDASKEKNRKVPAPNAPNLIVLDKRNGRLVATDDTPIMPNILHGQWSSCSLGVVDGRKLVFYGGGDGVCYAFEALASVPGSPVRLKTVWSYDCIPPEYKPIGNYHRVTSYYLGDKRVRGTLNNNDGKYVGRSEIIATPVFVHNRVYVAIGRDPAHGRGRGALHCIDPRGHGNITSSGKVWTYQGLDRTLSTVSVADGLLYIADVGGRLHCLDAETGRRRWVHDAKCEVWGSTLVADGKVYMPTSKGLLVLEAGEHMKVITRVGLGGKMFASPVVANGTLYVATTTSWLWAVGKP
jgi:outer membrane protein assembly factor BamB